MYRPGAACPADADSGAPRPLLLAAVVALAFASTGCAAAEVRCASDRDCAAPTTCDLGRCEHPHRARPDLRARRIAIPAEADGTVLSATCCLTDAYGAHDSLLVGGAGAGAAYRSYVSFELGALRGSRVERALLRLEVRPSLSRGSGPLEVLVLASGRSWSERSLSWASQPGPAGGPFGAALIRPDEAGVTVIDVTRLVAAWASGSVPNTGLVLRARAERGDDRVAWHSSEALVPEARPLLEVEAR